MIVWLASWPRSGNTLLRITLHRVFGLRTWSIYDDTTDIGAHDEASALVGHLNHGQGREEFIAESRMVSGIRYVKTHELPPDGSPAIYMVRDGRAAVVSQWHYTQQFWDDVPTLEEVIRGVDWPGSWSEHVRSWALVRRPRTLVLRFEDLVRGDLVVLDQLSSFVELPRRRAFDVRFDDLHAVYPGFFRVGSNERSLAELPVELERLFMELHGDTLASLGYA